jgi:hypothetical protein
MDIPTGKSKIIGGPCIIEPRLKQTIQMLACKHQ